MENTFKILDAERDYALAFIRNMSQIATDVHVYNETADLATNIFTSCSTVKDYRCFTVITVFGAVAYYVENSKENALFFCEEINRLISEGEEENAVYALIRTALGYYLGCNRDDKFYSQPYISYHMRASIFYDYDSLYFMDMTDSEKLLYEMTLRIVEHYKEKYKPDLDVTEYFLSNAEPFMETGDAKSTAYFDILKKVSKEISSEDWFKFRTDWACIERSGFDEWENVKPRAERYYTDIIWIWMSMCNSPWVKNLDTFDYVYLLAMFTLAEKEITPEKMFEFTDAVNALEGKPEDDRQAIKAVLETAEKVFGVKIVSACFEVISSDTEMHINKLVRQNKKLGLTYNLSKYAIPVDLSEYSSFWEIKSMAYEVPVVG